MLYRKKNKTLSRWRPPFEPSSLIPNLSNGTCGRRCWVSRIVLFFVEDRICSWSWCTRLIEWLPSVDLFFKCIDWFRFSTYWSANHVIALGIRHSDVFEGFGILRLPGSRFVGVDSVVFLTRSSLVSNLFSKRLRCSVAIDWFLLQRMSYWTTLAELPRLWPHLNVYW
jgi:hypothetical protein